nr:hypothetical protein [Tanacetum cinerariifolium]
AKGKLHAQVRIVRTDKGTKFLNKTLHVYFASKGINHQTSFARTPEQNGVFKRQNLTLVEAARTMLSAAKTLHAYFAAEGIQHQTFVARTPEQNGVVERWNRTLVEAARTMLSAAKVPLFFCAEAIATTCFTQNRSLVIPRHEKTPYHIINDQKPSVKFFTFLAPVFNKRTRVIMESIHVNFDELPQMASVQLSSDPTPECQTMALVQLRSDPAPECQTMVSVQISSDPAPECQTMVSVQLSFDPAPECQTMVSDQNSSDPAPEIQIHQSPNGIFINQAMYAQEILVKHGMTSCDGIGTPMATKYLDADLSGTPVDQMRYRSKVGALMYLTASRPDTMHATCYCARYQAQPTEKHLTAV